jgi:putative MFS transporter
MISRVNFSLKSKPSLWRLILCPAVIVAALGYFVDIYDLLLFSIVRVPSLQSLGLSGQELTDWGLLLLNVQMAGMLVGGVLFGVLGDKKGRLKILFGSILLYSLANLLNAAVHSLSMYAILRFVAGVGLAGELGAGITLVAESLPKDKRGYGTALVATVGVSGAVVAYLVSEHFPWRECYAIGGVLGLLLLALRVGVRESHLFKESSGQADRLRGNFLQLFTSWTRFSRFVLCILVGIQFWYVVGILMTLSPEFAKDLGVLGEVKAGRAVFFFYGGLTLGDLASGLLSQWLKSRRKALACFMLGSLVSLLAFFGLRGLSIETFYWLCGIMGFCNGYWVIFVTIGAEQFGTNLRATVATSVPYFVRGSLVPISFVFALLRPELGLLNAAAVVGGGCVLLSLLALWKIEETYHRDLNFLEID